MQAARCGGPRQCCQLGGGQEKASSKRLLPIAHSLLIFKCRHADLAVPQPSRSLPWACMLAGRSPTAVTKLLHSWQPCSCRQPLGSDMESVASRLARKMRMLRWRGGCFLQVGHFTCCAACDPMHCTQPCILSMMPAAPTLHIHRLHGEAARKFGLRKGGQAVFCWAAQDMHGGGLVQGRMGNAQCLVRMGFPAPKWLQKRSTIAAQHMHGVHVNASGINKRTTEALLTLSQGAVAPRACSTMLHSPRPQHAHDSTHVCTSLRCRKMSSGCADINPKECTPGWMGASPLHRKRSTAAPLPAPFSFMPVGCCASHKPSSAQEASTPTTHI